MTLKINSVAPDFTAETSEGKLSFHKWLGDSWGVLFSHPKDFTPVCTTELGYMAKIENEFAKRSCKIIGLSVDSIDEHKEWKKDIEETQGAKVNYFTTSFCKFIFYFSHITKLSCTNWCKVFWM
jgi:alkyl hydroperoxide reductase subunit AhpC